ISQTLMLLCVVVAQIIAFNIYGSLGKGAKATTVLSFVAVLCSMIPGIPLVIRIVPLVCCALTVASLVLSQSAFLKAMGRRAKGAFSVWFALNFVVITNAVLALQTAIIL
ncbi:MAG: hypothetical protein Q4C99_10440, partial [Clostridia bacterium]|nr:hypothetical protein [Clostridia bacterium]